MHSELAIVTYLIVVVYVANFLMLSAVAARQAGRSVWLFNAGAPWQRWTGLAFRCAFAGAVLWPPVHMWTDVLGPSDPLTRAVHGLAASLTGHVLVAVGGAVALVSQYHMGAAWRIGAAEGEQGGLVDTGPFALSRNPVFIGQALLFVGLLLAYPDVVQLTITALALVAIRAQVRIEERVLRATFAAAYGDYAARVPRWIGRIRAREDASARR